MLERLDISNLALIEDIHIDFHEGFNVLTGETGAGKSIILGALNLLLGEKADQSAVRTGASEASISALISLDPSHELVPWLRERGAEPDDGMILVRRVLRQAGRGSIHVQSVPMTRTDLTTIGDALFDIHGQHEHQSLLQSDRQRKVLDAFGSLADVLETYGHSYRELESLKDRHGELVRMIAQSAKEADYLRFVAEELDRAQLKADEDVHLEEEVALLSQFETIRDNLETVHGALKGSVGEGAVSSLAAALQGCRRAAKADISLGDLATRIESSLIEVQDISDSIRDRLASMSFSQERLDELQGRLALLQRLKKKYGPALADVIAYRDRTIGSLARSEASDDEIKTLETQIALADKKVAQLASHITEKRKESALRLQDLIARRLSHLGMPHVVFSIEITTRERNIHGSDQVDFLFSANLGEPLRSLREIASGGELSRVMLALKTVLAESDDVETLVFDEVDAGIGGAVAIAVGEQMAELSSSRQVIAITHLASIASKADNHLVVFKETEGSRTYTRIRSVTGNSRAEELARMLSGHGQDEAALAHARTLMG